jgi:hypothetical protein
MTLFNRLTAVIVLASVQAALSGSLDFDPEGGVLPPIIGDHEPEETDTTQRLNLHLEADDDRGGGSLLPFDLDRLFSFADLIDGFEFPGGLRLDLGLDRIGIGCDF